MGAMNRNMNLPQIQRIMNEFEKESATMDMKEEMMSDAVDDVMDEGLEDEEEESDKILKQVLDEIGVDLSQQVRNPFVYVSLRLSYARRALAHGCPDWVGCPIITYRAATSRCHGRSRRPAQWRRRRLGWRHVGRRRVAGSPGCSPQGMRPIQAHRSTIDTLGGLGRFLPHLVYSRDLYKTCTLPFHTKQSKNMSYAQSGDQAGLVLVELPSNTGPIVEFLHIFFL